MLQLFASAEHHGDPRVPIRWCVGRETLEKLKQDGVLSPHLLILVTHGDMEVERKLVPLDQIMEFVDFHRAGAHTLKATIVWEESGNARKLKAQILGGRYKAKSFSQIRARDSEGNLWLDPDALKECAIAHREEGELTVLVDARFFAKEPSAFEKWWVNLWCEGPARDQCHFRRRRIVAYTIQPPIVLLWLAGLTLIRVAVVGFLLSICRRGITWSPLVHPWNEDTEDIWGGMFSRRGTIFTKTKDGKEARFRILLVPLSPIVFIVASLGLLVVNRFVQDLGLTVAAVLGLVLLAQGILTAFFSFVIGVFYFFLEVIPNKIGPRVERFAERHKTLGNVVKIAALAVLVVAALQAMQITAMILQVLAVCFALALVLWGIGEIVERVEAFRAKRLNAVLAAGGDGFDREALIVHEALTCRQGALQAELRALPKSRRTLYLRFRELKTKVCRPYGR